jgi:uncharacterized peroxidase-related enzyme
MGRIKQVKRDVTSPLEPLLALIQSDMGFVPNSMLTMAHWPELVTAFAGLGATVLQSGELEPELKQLIALVASRAHGCQYCQAHTAHSAHARGVSEEKLAAVFEFESSTLFTDRERAALRLGWHGALQPNAVSRADVEAAQEHFSERQIVEITAVIALFGFLNRWNDSMATDLEDVPRRFAEESLAGSGWQRGKH